MSETIKEKSQKFYIQSDDLKDFISAINKLYDKLNEINESFKKRDEILSDMIVDKLSIKLGLDKK